MRGTLDVARAGRYELLLGADESAELVVDGETVASKSGGQFAVVPASRTLAAGSHTLEASASDAGGIAHVLVDVHRDGD
jgi:hypothetical protein